MHQPIVKIALLIAIIVLGSYTFMVNLDVQDYQDVHSICSKAVEGFPADKLAPLARSGDLIVNQLPNGMSMSNEHCTCVVETKNNLVTINNGTSCSR